MTIAGNVTRLRATFNSGRTRSVEWRLEQLRALKQMLADRETNLIDALAGDMHRSEVEAVGADLAVVAHDVDDAIKNVHRWIRPEHVRLPVVQGFGASAHVVHEPLGLVLIIGAWNYPIMLTLGPLVGAIAGGNCAVIKPSELSEASAVQIERSVGEYLDPDAFAVVQGGVPETTELLDQRFDHIFFTGSAPVGRIVMAAAAEHLTPVTLELGGKSPAIVDADADLDVTARRITQGKFANAGQTCVAVDYVLAHESIVDALTDRLAATTREFYGGDPIASPDFARIINDRNFERLSRLLENQNIVTGGQTDAASHYIAPTIIRDVDPDSPVMQAEIFGPILPMISVTNMRAATDFVNSREKPLALYVFTKKPQTQQEIIDLTSAGGSCINDTLMHVTIAQAPFGGVGESGIGQYHGKDGYDTFTHRRTVLNRTTKLDPSVRYPPYGELKAKIAEKLS